MTRKKVKPKGTKGSVSKFKNALMGLKPVFAHITVVLDRSGSMGSVKASTIQGFNQFLTEQKKGPGSATITLTQFDDRYDVVYDKTKIEDAPDLDSTSYQPRGSTALLDAIGRTIKAVDGIKAKKNIFVVVTDGHENASSEFTRQQVNVLIKERRKKGWEFVFLGANQDAIDEGGKLGIAAANSMTYGATAQGTSSAFASLSANTLSVRSMTKTNMSFEDEDRKKQEDAGVTTKTTA